MAKRPKFKASMGELVPVAGDRLRALMQVRAISYRDLSKRVNGRRGDGALCTSSTLMAICAGRQRRCRAPLRARVAAVLDTTVAWIAGDDVPAPGLIGAAAQTMSEIRRATGLPIDLSVFHGSARPVRSEVEIATLWSALTQLDGTLVTAPALLKFMYLFDLGAYRQMMRSDGQRERVSAADQTEFSDALTTLMRLVLQPLLAKTIAYDEHASYVVRGALDALFAISESAIFLDMAGLPDEERGARLLALSPWLPDLMLRHLYPADRMQAEMARAASSQPVAS